jgi:hypothetical protein
MARTTRKTGSARNGYILPDDKLKQREAAFVIYRDMGSARSMHKLAELLKRDRADIAVTRPSLERWSRMHDWQARVKAHDSAMAKGRVQAPQRLRAPWSPIQISIRSKPCCQLPTRC